MSTEPLSLWEFYLPQMQDYLTADQLVVCDQMQAVGFDPPQVCLWGVYHPPSNLWWNSDRKPWWFRSPAEAKPYSNQVFARLAKAYARPKHLSPREARDWGKKCIIAPLYNPKKDKTP